MLRKIKKPDMIESSADYHSRVGRNSHGEIEESSIYNALDFKNPVRDMADAEIDYGRTRATVVSGILLPDGSCES